MDFHAHTFPPRPARLPLGLGALACLALSCTAPQGASRAMPTAAVSTPATAASSASSAEDRPVDVTVTLKAPVRARYEPSLLGAVRPMLGVAVTNRSSRPLDVADLRVHLEAVREGVSFRCAEVVGSEPGEREPSTLEPGASHVFDRKLDCALPLVGAYAVRVAVSFGKGEWSSPREVRAFSLTVTALPSVGPREIAGLPGLWAAMGSSGVLLGGVGRGHARTLITLVNATDKPLEVPRMRVTLRTYRVGNPIPCADSPIALRTPAVLGPAESYYEPIEVSCLGLSVEGTYEIVARLVVPGGSEGDREIALGRLRVEVSANPAVSFPRQWR